MISSMKPFDLKKLKTSLIKNDYIGSYVGLPRSGSTLLVNLINQHPDVYGSPDSLLSQDDKSMSRKIV